MRVECSNLDEGAVAASTTQECASLVGMEDRRRGKGAFFSGCTTRSLTSGRGGCWSSLIDEQSGCQTCIVQVRQRVHVHAYSRHGQKGSLYVKILGGRIARIEVLCGCHGSAAFDAIDSSTGTSMEDLGNEAMPRRGCRAFLSYFGGRAARSGISEWLSCDLRNVRAQNVQHYFS